MKKCTNIADADMIMAEKITTNKIKNIKQLKRHQKSVFLRMGNNMPEKAKKILKEIEIRSRDLFLPIVGPEKGKLLTTLIDEYKPLKILEIGTLVGYSAILMSQHLPAGGKITTIEINKKIIDQAKRNIKEAGAEKIIEMIPGDAMRIIPKLKGSFDLLFLDAEKDEYYSYILLAENKLAENAIVVADNVKIFEDQLKDYLDYIKNSDHFTSETYDFGEDAMEVSFKH